MEQQAYDPVIGDYTLVRSRRSRRISLRIHPEKGVIVTVPYGVSPRRGAAFVSERRDWIRKHLDRMERKREQALAEGKLPPEGTDLDALVATLRKEAKAALPQRLSYWAERYGFTYGKVFIKHNRSNWGSCSAKGNINLNLNLMRLPEPLRDYVILHELSHLRHPNHGADFHALLDALCRDGLGTPARTLEKEVKSYRLI